MGIVVMGGVVVIVVKKVDKVVDDLDVFNVDDFNIKIEDDFMSLSFGSLFSVDDMDLDDFLNDF